ncbi:MAG: glycoside hydrolase family 16 protein [Solirubrobacteraceae bacterium]
MAVIVGVVVAGLIGGSRMFWGKIPTTPARATKPTYGQCPTPATGSTQSVGGKTYGLEGLDTFTKAAPFGSFASKSPNQVVYRGDHGLAWTEYPDGWPSTYSAGGAEGYQPSTVLSVHNGVLDFYLHSDPHGNPVGADPSPLPAGRRYQTYGAWSFCEKVVPADSHNLDDFHQAPLLWPRESNKWASAESDYPEADLNSLNFSSFSHWGGSGAQDVFDAQSVERNFDPTQWHVYTQTWGPGFRSYYIDGVLVGTSTSQVWSGPERWQLQIEPSGVTDGDSGHVYVKWVWIGRGPLRRPVSRGG